MVIVVPSAAGFPPRPRFFATAAALVRAGGPPYHIRYVFSASGKERFSAMSIDKSLRRKNQLARSRNVLTRGERILTLQNEERWKDGRSPFGLPKVRVLKVAKKPKKA